MRLLFVDRWDPPCFPHVAPCRPFKKEVARPQSYPPQRCVEAVCPAASPTSLDPMKQSGEEAI